MGAALAGLGGGGADAGASLLGALGGGSAPAAAAPAAEATPALAQ